MRRRRWRGVPIVLGVLGVALALVASYSWRKPDSLPYRPAPSWLTHFAPEDSVGNTTESLKVLLPNPNVAILGFSHTRDPKDPQFQSAQSVWADFRPTVVLVEGKPSGPLASIGSIEKFGESGFVAAFARQKGLKHYTWDVPEDQMVASLVEHFPKEDVAMLITGNAYFSRFRFGKPADPDAELQSLIDKRGGYTELGGVIKTVADFDRLWKLRCRGAKDWRDTSDQFGLPEPLERVAQRSRQLRDCHLLESISNFSKRGERVLAAVGQSHAIRIEPALAHLPK